MEYRLTEKEFEYVQAFKRDLHMHPETAHHEFRTTEKIKEALSSLPGIDILDTGFRTGLIAVIRGREEGKKILLRADIDAIVQNEEYESPWKSQTPGVMHACGHDLHTSSLIGAAVILSKIKAAGELKNTVYLLFQPAEEGTTGARMVLDSGVLDEIKPDMCFGFHNWPKLRSGTVACHKGVLMSGKRNFTINIKGSGGHGSMPHLNIDPIVCSAAVIQSLQTVVSRNMDPLDSAVLSISMIEGGKPVNVVADDVMMTATIRSLSDKALDRAIERVESITMNTAHAYECEAEIDWKERIPSVFNTDEMYEVALRAAEETGAEITDAEPSLASEDFALYRTVAPSFFYWIGSTPEGEEPEDLHRPRFHTDDSIMKTAAELFVRAAMTE
jgi:amidohydrolase